ncbi:hypothetical protein ACI6QG_02670 [Roseococcus sp. DSY-14]|uniref:hypothetical protein n=1 Tax=Roseococcus sp. DSY-14 TaxID=3369650 RepID=UPI00387B369B
MFHARNGGIFRGMAGNPDRDRGKEAKPPATPPAPPATPPAPAAERLSVIWLRDLKPAPAPPRKGK